MNFDEIISREGTFAEKYERRYAKFGSQDLLPLWVADMDLPTSPAINQALMTRAKHPIYGYTAYHDAYFAAIVQWMQKAHDWSIEKEAIVPISGIVPALGLAVLALSDEGEGVIVQPPVYPPFFSAVKNHKRKVLENPLRLIEGHYEIDFEDFESKAKKAKLFLFCSPHNPTGRVWREEELQKIVDICLKYNVRIISDEVHADLVHLGHKHIPIATLKGAQKITITLNAPSKTFNVAGIASAYAIIENSALRRKFAHIFERFMLTQPTPFALCATVAAYTQSDAWLKELRGYLASNLHYVQNRLKTMFHIKPMPMEATFLLWLDCHDMALDDEALAHFFVHEAKLGLNAGVSFGSGGEGFMRLNFAVAREVLENAMDKLEHAYYRHLKAFHGRSDRT